MAHSTHAGGRVQGRIHLHDDGTVELQTMSMQRGNGANGKQISLTAESLSLRSRQPEHGQDDSSCKQVVSSHVQQQAAGASCGEH
jgi:hypothetical protein